MKLSVARTNISEVYARIAAQSPPHHFEFSDPFWVLITTILSHRTKDQVTDVASRNLFVAYGDCNGLAEADVSEVKSMISKVGFSSVKAGRVVEAARLVRDRFNGSVPRTLEELTTIPGVGRKTANVVLSDSLGVPAIAVDTHVQRISRRMGFTNSDDPAVTEQRLRRIVPYDLWIGFNPTLVEFGKKICRPVGPKCGDCNVSEFCEYFHSRNRKAYRKH